jgi:outer membrane immunogenic protein
MRKLLVVASLAAASIAAPAFAQDSGSPSFTGFRVEGLAGWDRPHTSGNHSDGLLYGVGAGYDYQAGRMVIGVEGEASDSTAKRCFVGVDATGDRLCTKAGRDLYVGGRIGAVVAPTTLLYAKAGYTNARVNTDYTGVAGGLASFNARDNLNGFRVGAGVQQSLGGNAYVKAEYRYSNYEHNYDRNQVVAGFGFRF